MSIKDCSNCEHNDVECAKEIVSKCLRGSTCTYCDSSSFGYPYGKDESRHCLNCGAEWSVWK